MTEVDSTTMIHKVVVDGIVEYAYIDKEVAQIFLDDFKKQSKGKMNT